jgi:hypothetical protein
MTRIIHRRTATVNGHECDPGTVRFRSPRKPLRKDSSCASQSDSLALPNCTRLRKGSGHVGFDAAGNPPSTQTTLPQAIPTEGTF